MEHMHVNIRMVVAMFTGLVCVIGAMALSGAHPQDLVHWPSLLVVCGITFGALAALRGLPLTGRVLVAPFVRRERSEAERAELVEALGVVERASFVAGFVGAMGGAVGMIAAYHEPSHIGPNVHVAVASLLYCVFLNALMVLPLKQQLTREVAPELQLSRPQAYARAVRGAAFLCVAGGALSMWPLPYSNLSLGPTLPGALFLLAGVVPSALVAGDSVLRSPVSERRQLWYSNGLLCSAVAALCCELLHVFSVLDAPELVGPGVAWAAAVVVLPVAGAVLLRLRTPHSDLLGLGGERSSSPYFAFAGFAVALLIGVTLFALFRVDALMADEAESPR